MIKKSATDSNRFYVCLFGKRYIFDKSYIGNKYVGWYRA